MFAVCKIFKELALLVVVLSKLIYKSNHSMERKITLVLTELISIEEIGEMCKAEIPDNSMITNILLHTACLIASLTFCFHYYI